MKKLLLVSILWLTQLSVSAHDPGEQLIGSGVRKYTFFALLFIFVTLVLWRVVVDYVANKILQKILLGLVMVVLGCVLAYFLYHWVLE